jgi:hypothetical protein
MRVGSVAIFSLRHRYGTKMLGRNGIGYEIDVELINTLNKRLVIDSLRLVEKIKLRYGIIIEGCSWRPTGQY